MLHLGKRASKFDALITVTAVAEKLRSGYLNSIRGLLDFELLL